MLISTLLALWAASIAISVVYARKMHLSVSLALFFGITAPLLSAFVYSYMGISGDRRLWSVSLVAIAGVAFVSAILAAILAARNKGYVEASQATTSVQAMAWQGNTLPEPPTTSNFHTPVATNLNYTLTLYFVMCRGHAGTFETCVSPFEPGIATYTISPDTNTVRMHYQISTGLKTAMDQMYSGCVTTDAQDWTCPLHGETFGVTHGEFYSNLSNYSAQSDTSVVPVTYDQYEMVLNQ